MKPMMSESRIFPMEHFTAGIFPKPDSIKKFNILKESYHIYQHSEPLLIIFKKLIDECISNLEAIYNLIPLFGHTPDTAYRPLPKNVLENIDDIGLYVTWGGDDPDCGTACSITTYNEEHYKNIKQHICSNQKKGHIKRAAIVLYIPTTYKQTLNKHGENYFSGMVEHELLHLLHITFSEDIAKRVGYGYAYAAEMAMYYGEKGFTDADVLEAYIKEPKITGYRITIILANLMYLTEYGEAQAWL